MPRAKAKFQPKRKKNRRPHYTLEQLLAETRAARGHRVKRVTQSKTSHCKKRRPRCTLEQLLAESKAIGLFRRTKQDHELLNSPRVGRELI